MTDHPTCQRTLYRLLGVEPDPDAMFDALEDQLDKLDHRGADIDVRDIAGCPAVVLSGGSEGPPGWLGDAQQTTGMFFGFVERRHFVLTLIAVDGLVYALGYGTGHRFVPVEHKDPRFGLALAVRVADTNLVRDVVRRKPGRRGRVDSTVAAGGLPLWAIPIDRHSEVVSRFGARVEDLELTAKRKGQKQVLVDGGAGLKAHFGVRPDDLVSDIREVAATLEQRRPVSELAFIEHVSTVTSPAQRERLDGRLDLVLASPAVAREELELSIPDECLDDYREVRSAEIRIGSKPKRVPEVTIEAIANRTSVQEPGRRTEALRAGRIQLFADADGTERLSSEPAVKWVEATVAEGTRRFHLINGAWMEIDIAYADAQDELILDLLTKPVDLELPDWRHGWDEGAYLDYASARHRMPLLDQKWILPGDGHRFEACDLLGPGNELIHVKQAATSKPLSHLFNQGLVSAYALHTSNKVRTQFARLVEEHGNGRTVPYGFVPGKVVFAFRRASGRPLTVQSLFPFSKIALAHTANRLQDMGVEVHVVIIGTVED